MEAVIDELLKEPLIEVDEEWYREYEHVLDEYLDILQDAKEGEVRRIETRKNYCVIFD